MADLKEKSQTEQLKKAGNDVAADNKEYTVHVVRDYYGAMDPFYLPNKDPNFQYRWLRDDPRNISTKTGNLLFQKGGWQLCPREHILRVFKDIKDHEVSPDGFLRRGDTILAFMPKKLYEEKEQYKEERAKAPISNVKRLIDKGDPYADGSRPHGSMKGIRTKKDLGMGD